MSSELQQLGIYIRTHRFKRVQHFLRLVKQKLSHIFYALASAEKIERSGLSMDSPLTISYVGKVSNLSARQCPEGT
jgi:hypothetical protein